MAGFFGLGGLIFVALIAGVPWWLGGNPIPMTGGDMPSNQSRSAGLLDDFLREVAGQFTLGRGKLRHRIGRFLRLSCCDTYWSPERLLVVSSFLVIVTFTLGLVLVAAYPITPTLVVGMITFSLLMGALPLLWLHEKGQQRRREVEDNFPLVLEFLAMFMAAGMSLIQSVERVASLVKGELSEELKYTLRDIQLGLPRELAWQNLGDRLSVEVISTTLVALSDGERQGTPLAVYCRKQAEILRFQRLQRMEKGAGEAPVRLLLPMGLVCVSCLLLIGGALYLRAGEGGLP